MKKFIFGLAPAPRSAIATLSHADARVTLFFLFDRPGESYEEIVLTGNQVNGGHYTTV